MRRNELRIIWLSKLVSLIGIILSATSTVSYANVYDECVAGQQRYNKHIAAKKALSNQSWGEFGTQRFDYYYAQSMALCNKIAPEVGFANCEKFLQSGTGSPAQRQWAQKVSSVLADVYRGCQSQ